MTPPVARAAADADAVEAALSLERFARYVAWADGDRERAVSLYTLNTQVSEALYVPLQALEVALRNRIHTVMSAAHGPGWFQPEAGHVTDRQAEQVRAAVAELTEAGKPIEDGRVVAALTFSFWTSMFGREQDDLWKRTLHKIATRDGRFLSRKDFTARLTQVRLLRNRIAHHEPILYWNLPKLHQSMLEMTRWLSPAMDDWRGTVDRFAQVHPAERLALPRPGKDEA
ncbi:MAG: hypothetical protein DI624_00510 [Brevundimonas sp.]|uniref:Abi family protein n=1 Tax=Brevundimonas sp. TaxID=1871086 RepID=UPI000DAF82E4|nr:Abi family protein [Brevundimonas sp.]MBN9464083.1 hypothetical protein [Brevundimonas sp.]PZU01491.1 MAG: hypothetical protein DI624_00510 [Brevundimonas sp.]